jgi:hypothetical protein
LNFCNSYTDAGAKPWGFHPLSVPFKYLSFTTTHQWSTPDFFTARISMDDLVTLGFYYGDIAPVSVKFSNYLGGYFPEDALEATDTTKCLPFIGAGYSDAT